MWLSLDSEFQYRFEGDISPVAFFQNLPLLLEPTDTLVLCCYDARTDIRDFLSANSIPPAWERFRVIETWDLNRREYPRGAAFHLRPDSSNLDQLIEFSQSVTKSIELCDHIAAYSRAHPLFIYHGTFWKPFFISACIPRSRVEAFSRAIAVPFEVIDFHRTYSSSASTPNEPNG